MIFRSPFEDVRIPDDVTLHDFLFEHARRNPDRTAFTDGPTGRTRTFQEVIDDSYRVANALHDHGIRPGDVCAIFSPNHFDWPIAYLGILITGASATLINPLYTIGELNRHLEVTEPKVLFTISGLLETTEQAANETSVERIYTFDEADGHPSVARMMAQSTSKRLSVQVDPESVAIIPTSSGTSGLPKAVMLSHRNIVANGIQTVSTELFPESGRILGCLPMFHIAGLGMYVHGGMTLGANTVIYGRFDMEETCHAIEHYGISTILLVPPLVVGLLKSPHVEKYNFESLQLVLSGAAPLGPEMSAEFKRRFGLAIHQAYGMSETSPLTHIAPPDAAIDGSAGVLVPNTEAMIVDVDTLEPLGPNQNGEIWIRGSQVMRGYLNRPDATAETITDDGWLRTGDIGYVDDNGYFFIVDRLKELIKYKAYQVAPAELEDVLKAHPRIVDAAVVGVPDEDAGELPKACVVPEDQLTGQDVIDYVAERVAPYKKVRLVEFIDQVPKNPSGKILRRVLRDESARSSST